MEAVAEAPLPFVVNRALPTRGEVSSHFRFFQRRTSGRQRRVLRGAGGAAVQVKKGIEVFFNTAALVRRQLPLDRLRQRFTLHGHPRPCEGWWLRRRTVRSGQDEIVGVSSGSVIELL